MSTPVYVVDATVILHDLLQVPSAAEAVHAFFERVATEKAKVIAPMFLDVEVANVIQKAAEPAARAEILEHYHALAIERVLLHELILKAAVEVAVDTGTSVYDAQYHALAVANKGIYVTLDPTYYHAAEHLGSVELLA